ncbi:hypothetical protein [Streptomyces anulatus]|uniref:hypothetical protein n=1 Tax=Streptomyces TaxID=1883 RepID=UPI0034457EDD
MSLLCRNERPGRKTPERICTVHCNSSSTCGPELPRLSTLLVVVAVGAVAAQGDAWASALGTAATVYAVMSTGNQNRRS